jgi:hypothetical protein
VAVPSGLVMTVPARSVTAISSSGLPAPPSIGWR